MTRIRYRVWAANFTAAIINFGDRVALSVAAPFILAEYHFSPVVWGIILSSFFWTYTPFALIGGFLVDRFGVRRAYLACMLGWSLTIPLTAAAWDVTTFIFARLLFGIGEAPQGPISAKLTANWFPARQASTMLNTAQAGTTIGPILATPLIVWISSTLGWRPAFVLLGLIGVLWCGIWWLVGRDRPEDHPGVDAAELAYIRADHAPPTVDSAATGFRSLARDRRVVALAIAFFAYSWVLFMFLTWYPTYLVEARGVAKADLGAIATYPWITATVGLVAGGVVADRLIRRFGSFVTPRKWMIVGCLTAVAVCFAPSPFVDSPDLALLLVCVATFFLLASYQYLAVIVAIVPPHYTGRMAGLVQMCSAAAGILAPIATGWIVEITGSFTAAFVLGGAIALLGAALTLVLVRDTTVATKGDHHVRRAHRDLPA
ncbi:MFS transporter [Crossiella cryophila]|uniref:ACS family hexuronate transporter-like MFS transporter n=1 Tax=Crossiella cryophila TaxID=43355 RepID=A0A7W7CFD7_9PSEU|nr:MFS transporter [Crossiella cryophila]MBB4679952.1 ACS family hexuronate transporter-like MFS transporter [Crossiella cryophila]